MSSPIQKNGDVTNSTEKELRSLFGSTDGVVVSAVPVAGPKREEPAGEAFGGTAQLQAEQRDFGGPVTVRSRADADRIRSRPSETDLTG